MTRVAVLASFVLLLTLAIGVWVVRPLSVGPIGPDAAAPVIQFQRLVAGQRLEGYLSQTSKPLLTLVYGAAWAVAGDWRAISLLAILSFAAFVALATVLAARIAGLAAASFVAAGLALSPQLLRDVTFAYGVSWTLLAVTIAGLAVTTERPRYALAGIALALGALARPEVLAITSIALAIVAFVWLAARIQRTAAPPRGSWMLAIGLLAVPILALHDWRLTGDPWFWLNTAQANSAGAGNVRSLLATIRFVGHHVLDLAPLVVLGALGAADLAIRKRWIALVAVTITPIAVAAFFTASGARGTVVDSRYLIPIDISLVLTAGVGVGALRAPVIRAWLRRPRRLPRAANVVIPWVAAAMLALAVAPTWFGNPTIRESIRTQREKEANAAIGIAQLHRLLSSIPDWRRGPDPTGGTIVLLPIRLRAQAVADLDLPLWAGTKMSSGMIRPQDGLPVAGTIVYHDRLDDKPASAWAPIEVSQTTVVGKLKVVPLFVDVHAGIWIVRIDPLDAATTRRDPVIEPG